MDFVNSDRSRDAEFTRGLQSYNSQILENNQELSAQIDKSKGDLVLAKEGASEVADLSNLKTNTQLGGIAAGGIERLSRVPGVLKKASAAKAAAQIAANRAGERGIGSATRGVAAAAPVEVGTSAGARAARVGTSAGARAAAPAAEVGEAVTEGALEGGGKILAKGALIAAKGAGLAGSALSAGSAIYGLAEGKKFHMSEQGAEIGGALLDVVGTGLEFIPGGQLFGLGLMAAGTALSTVGAVNEALETEPTKDATVADAEKEQSKTQADLEAAKRQAVLGVTSAAQGSAAVGRQAQ